MSTITVPVIEARAVLDDDTGTFTIQARLESGREVWFSSVPPPEILSELLSAFAEKPAKPKRKRTTRKKENQ